MKLVRLAVPLFKAGYFAIGAVYALTGYLSLSVALGMGGKIADHEDSLQIVARQPFGIYIIPLIGLAILGYVSWRFAQAILNADGWDKGVKGIALRCYAAFSGILYLLLAIFCFKSFLVGKVVPDEQADKELSADVLALFWGEGLLIAAGLGFIAVSIYQIRKGLTGAFKEEFKLRELSSHEHTLLNLSGRIGLPMRGLTFGLIGAFAISSGYQSKPEAVKGTEALFVYILAQPFGTYLLGGLAMGFMFYAMYCFISARARVFV
ncbi:MAG: DUF1206 domain-containing protein [Oligoflexus sp.]|nr:DUF1206 domain-containing protein [Oligoflexus sp.]